MSTHKLFLLLLQPTPLGDPKLVAVSPDALQLLGLDPAEVGSSTHHQQQQQHHRQVAVVSDAARSDFCAHFGTCYAVYGRLHWIA